MVLGANVTRKTLLQLVDCAGSGGIGTVIDTALLVAKQYGAIGNGYGIQFGAIGCLRIVTAFDGPGCRAESSSWATRSPGRSASFFASRTSNLATFSDRNSSSSAEASRWGCCSACRWR